MTNSRTHLHNIDKCDECTDGSMIVKSKGNQGFYGCTGYDIKTKSGCRNMRLIL